MDIKLIWLLVLTIGTLANVILHLVRNGKGFKYNPHPPGEAPACKDIKKAVERMDATLEKHGEQIAQILVDTRNREKRLDRLEGKINGK